MKPNRRHVGQNHIHTPSSSLPNPNQPESTAIRYTHLDHLLAPIHGPHQQLLAARLALFPKPLALQQVSLALPAFESGTYLGRAQARKVNRKAFARFPKVLFRDAWVLANVRPAKGGQDPGGGFNKLGVPVAMGKLPVLGGTGDLPKTQEDSRGEGRFPVFLRLDDRAHKSEYAVGVVVDFDVHLHTCQHRTQKNLRPDMAKYVKRTPGGRNASEHNETA